MSDDAHATFPVPAHTAARTTCARADYDHEYARSLDIVRKAYYHGAMEALTSSQEKILSKLVDLLEEYGFIQPLDYGYEDMEAKLRRARPIMQLLVQDLWQ